MNERPSTYDLIVAGDTFNYFGDLWPLFDSAGFALRTARATLPTNQSSASLASSWTRIRNATPIQREAGQAMQRDAGDRRRSGRERGQRCAAGGLFALLQTGLQIPRNARARREDR